jgi:hypothetical protein
VGAGVGAGDGAGDPESPPPPPQAASITAEVRAASVASRAAFEEGGIESDPLRRRVTLSSRVEAAICNWRSPLDACPDID